MDRLYQTTNHNRQDSSVPHRETSDSNSRAGTNAVSSDIYFSRNKEGGTVQPEQTDDHQSSTSLQLSDSKYTFENKLKGQPPNPNQDKDSIKMEPVEIQKVKLLVVRELAEAIGMGSLSMNGLKQTIISMREQIGKSKSNKEYNVDMRRSATSVQSDCMSKRQSQTERALDKKDQEVSVAVKSLNQNAERHRLELSQICQRLRLPSNFTDFKAISGVYQQIDSVWDKLTSLQAQNQQLQTLSSNQAQKLKDLYQAYSAKLAEKAVQGVTVERLQAKDAQYETLANQMVVLRQSQQMFRESASSLEQLLKEQQQHQQNRSRSSIYRQEDTPTFNQAEGNAKDTYQNLLKQKDQQNRMLTLVIQDLSSKLDIISLNELKYSKTSIISNQEPKVQGQKSQIQNLAGLGPTIGSLQKDLVSRSEELEQTRRVLMSKQEQNQFYTTLIAQKNNQISGLETTLESTRLDNEVASDKLKKEIKLLQYSLSQSLQTHQRHVCLTSQQMETLKQIGINLEKENSQLLQMVRQYQSEISKLVKTGKIPSRPQSLTSQNQSQKFDVRASAIKKELDHIVASIENKHAMAVVTVQEVGVTNKANKEVVFRNPFETSKSNSAINSTPISMKIMQNEDILYGSTPRLTHKELPKQYLLGQATSLKLFPSQQQTVKHKQLPRMPHFQQIRGPKTTDRSPTSRVSPTPVFRESPNTTKTIISERRSSTSKGKIVQQSPFQIQSPKNLHQQGQHTSSRLIPQAQSPRLSTVTVTDLNPVSRQLERPSQQQRSSVYFQNTLNPITEVLIETASKVSSSVSHKSQTSKPNPRPPSIYNLSHLPIPSHQLLVSNSSQIGMEKQGYSQPGMRVLQMEDRCRSDCC